MELGDLLPQVTSDDILAVRHDSRVGRPAAGRLAAAPAGRRRAGPRLDRAEERPGQAVPGAVRAWRTPSWSSPTRRLRAIAERAMEKDTGARGLRSIIEEVMLDIMFELPDQPEQTKYLITDDIVYGREQVVPAAGTEDQERLAAKGLAPTTVSPLTPGPASVRPTPGFFYLRRPARANGPVNVFGPGRHDARR